MSLPGPSQQHFWRKPAQNPVPLTDRAPGRLTPGPAWTPFEVQLPAQKSPETQSYQPPRTVQDEQSAFSSRTPEGTPVSLYAATLDDKEMRETYEEMADMFSIVTATERLERMQTRYPKAISSDDYQAHCKDLITLYGDVRDSAGDSIPRLEKFIATWELRAGKARLRLLRGVVSKEPVKPTAQNKFVFQCTSLIHHVGSCIDYDQVTVGMLLPDLTSLMKTLLRITALEQGFDFHQTLRSWVEKLNAMPAADELSTDDAKQLKLDLDTGYADFESAISN